MTIEDPSQSELTHFWWRGPMTIEDPLLSAHGYQLLPLATSQ